NAAGGSGGSGRAWGGSSGAGTGGGSGGSLQPPHGDAGVDRPATGDGGTGGSGGRGGAGPGGRSGSGGTGAGGAGGARSCVVAPAGEQVVSLAGSWTFTPAGGAATPIEVPGGGWVAQGFKVSSARYARQVTIPTLGSPQATLLELGAVNHQAALSIDGTPFATNTTSFTPSVFDITRAVTPGGQAMLAIDVKGRDALRNSFNRKLVPDAAEWSPNIPQGIFRSASLRVLPVLHVSDAFVTTDVANDMVRVAVSVTNSGTAAMTGTVSVALSSLDCAALSYPALPSQPVGVPAGQTVTVTLGPVRWGLGASSYWWPNVPYVPGYRAKLHGAAVTVTNAAGAAHTLPVRFGFRQIRQVGTHYELNGVRVNFRGDSLQGADYDSIATTAKGNGDAYDLFPGFLPPSAGNAGWPAAVDNWQRLNYNVARIHQEPATPYMLDVADELGFMLIDETAIRGTSGDEDFTESDGQPNMLAHLKALIARDRNHPSVIRWSQCNEAENDVTNSTGFQLNLYQTAMAADGTRPVSADGRVTDSSYAGVPNANFAVYDHYPDGITAYTETVRTSTTRPFGVGEYIWSADVTAQGMVWFATSTLAMRLKDASDLRPYTLLSGWASFVPGVKTAMVSLEPTYPAGVVNHPHFGEDNLADPWSNAIIMRIQRGFNPVAVIDTAFWTANHLSNAAGGWPVTVETAAHGATLSRQLVVFNDTFAGTDVDVAWQMHTDSPTGAVSDQGTMRVSVPLGGHTAVPISVKAPATGTRGYLVLQSSKNGVVVFTEDAEYFNLQ
ncbi:MAG TPA: glycoside hydrolase family 2 TIM barrel-domain containing protein, partial [Polyangia bacterium]|nr:glycoside hydrolase family 2 TIM barrel-domain containing protein [Polyangia bacterium]